MSESVDTLFAEFVDVYQAGGEFDPRQFLQRAGSNGEEFLQRVERYLAESRPPEPSPEAVAAMQAWMDGDSPLLTMRTAAGVSRDAVVDAIVGDTGLEPAKRDRVARRYHDLEAGLLNPGRVDRRIIAAIARILRVKVSDIPMLNALAPPAAPAGVFYRAPADALMSELADAHVAYSRPPELDEVDRLFGIEP